MIRDSLKDCDLQTQNSQFMSADLSRSSIDLDMTKIFGQGLFVSQKEIEKEKIKRYTIIENDEQFKQYTKEGVTTEKMAERIMKNELKVMKADFFSNQFMVPEKSSIVGDNWSERADNSVSINNPNMLQKIFKKGAQ